MSDAPIPEVVVYVEGGGVKAVRSTMPVLLKVFDQDDVDADPDAENEDSRLRLLFGIEPQQYVVTWWEDVAIKKYAHAVY